MEINKSANQQINIGAGGTISSTTITIGDVAGRDINKQVVPNVANQSEPAHAVPADTFDPARVAQLVELRNLLVERFSAEDLRDLCFALGLDYDDLGGEGKVGKARELVSYLDHRRRLGDLVRVGKELRPELPWDQISPPELG